MVKLQLKEEVYAVVGAALDVYNELGPGFWEAVYHEAMEIETAARGIPFASRSRLQITCKRRLLKKEYEADMVTHNQLVVEFKALERLSSREDAQLLNYLKATGHRVGLLINFDHPSKLEWKRLVK